MLLTGMYTHLNITITIILSRNLAPSQLKDRLHKMHDVLCALKIKVKRLEKAKQAINEAGLDLGKEDHADLMQLMEENRKRVHDTHSENSFQRIFWEQQMKAASCSSKSSMRWHPIIVYICSISQVEHMRH